MIKAFLALFKRRSEPKTDFSEFFVSTSAKEKERILKEVVQQASQDQLEVIKRYEKTFPKAA